MVSKTRRVDYYYTTVHDDPEKAYEVLSHLKDQGVNLLAFVAVPMGTDSIQFAMFPDEDASMEHAAQRAGLELDGPHPALMIQGIDQLGALAGVHHKFVQAGVHPFATSGITDGSGSYAYLVYLRPEQVQLAEAALGG